MTLKADVLAASLYQTAASTPKNKHEKLVLEFLNYLKRKGALNLLPRVIKEIKKYGHRLEGITDVTIETASVLDIAEIKEIIKILNLAAEKTVVEQKIKPEIISGITITIDDKRLDGSVKGRLAAVRLNLQ